MMKQLPFQLDIPVLYINPWFNSDAGLVEEVARAGGIGIVERAVPEAASLRVAHGVRHGVRIALDQLRGIGHLSNIALAVIRLEDADKVAQLEPGTLAGMHVPFLVEVGSASQACGAEKAGAAGIIAKGYEAPGWVSQTGGLVLLQEILAVCDLPLFLQGGIGLNTAAGAIAAGATGVVLDVQLLFAQESGIDDGLKRFFESLSSPATTTLADNCGRPCRVYSRIGTRMVRELRKMEESLTQAQYDSFREKISAALVNATTSPDKDEALLPISEDILTAKSLADEFKTAAAILVEFGRRMARSSSAWPFSEGSKVADRHGTRFPIVQGPMAHVSDNTDFLAEVVARGALPFLALGNMPGPIAKQAIQSARKKTQGKFGVGLIGLEVNRECYEAHLEIMKEESPPFTILAAGDVELAKRIEKMGTVCYLHCPSPALVSEGLKAGLRNFVFEGCESGGHIGNLGSLNLWSANLRELELASKNGIPLDQVTVLFAGGIASARASAFVGSMVGDLAVKGLAVGLQMGTAYLSTQEAVSTGAITDTYRELVFKSDHTVVVGRTVNTKARAAASPMALRIMDLEQERITEGVPLRDRKALYEKDNLGALRLAAKGCAIDPKTACSDQPMFCDLDPKAQLDRGLYLMGQVVSLLSAPTTIEKLHSEIIEQGHAIFEARKVTEPKELAERKAPVEVDQPPVEQVETESYREPIAVVGIALRFPGADSLDSFWDMITSGRSGIIEVPEGRWENVDFYYDPDPKAPDKSYAKIGGFITDFTFDPIKYRIPPSVGRQMDRSQQMAVTCVGEALEDAGYKSADLKGRKVGIFIGNSMGGAVTDLYALRVGLQRALAFLTEALDKMDLDHQARKALLDQFSARYLKDLPQINEDSLPGELSNVISGRIANVFDLEGPNFTVDAACASSMAAVMNAVASLREDRINYAVTGGVDTAMHPSSFVKFCKIGALSPDGSRPFDEDANGFVMGEGAGILILKRLSDAIRDKDKIYCTILDVGSGSDGSGKGITAPNSAGQERAIRACLDEGGISAASMGLIEAHGTSTRVGDKTELEVLDRYFREAGLSTGTVCVGSVKSQIGHLKAASGAAGIIKSVLSLYHRTLPPTINVSNPNSCIDWNASPLFLLDAPRAWEAVSSLPRRAGVSAFGFGGTNFHVCLEEHVPGRRVKVAERRTAQRVEYTVPVWPRPPEMTLGGESWVIGASDIERLATKIDDLANREVAEAFRRSASHHRDEAYKYPTRIGFAAASREEALKKLTLIKEGIADAKKRAFMGARGIHFSEKAGERSNAGIAFMFPGQGSQYPYMLRDLAERFPIVAQTFEEADKVMSSLGLPPVTASVFPELGNGSLAVATPEMAEAIRDGMKDTQILQPMILTANVAIFRLLVNMGVTPTACGGHSLGEYAACVAAGVFSFTDALQAVAVRGREMARVSIADPGLMMSIPADARVVEDVLSRVDGYVVAANKNSPKQTVISGETKAVKKAGELFKARGIEGALLPVSAAFHSGVVAPARKPFMQMLRKLKVNPPSIAVISNVTGDYYPVGPAAPEKITDLLGKQFSAPVEWVKTLRRLHADGIRIFIECGPKRVMTNLALDTLPDDVLVLPTNHPKKGGIIQLMETLAALAVEGVPVNLTGGLAAPGLAEQYVRKTGPVTLVVHPEPAMAQPAPKALRSPLEPLLDEELRKLADQREFRNFLELQGEPIRSLIKSGFQNYVAKIVPMERTAKLVASEGIDFQAVAVSGIAAGLPSDVRFSFDRENLDDLILGRNFIKKVPESGQRRMLDKNIERLYKGPSGEAELQVVGDMSEVVKLAGFFTEDGITGAYGLDQRLARSMDVTTRLALAAGIEALKDAAIPLVRQVRTASNGRLLLDSWALPEALRAETGVIFASAFPGLASLVDEVTREAENRYGSGARKRLIEFYTGLISRVQDDDVREEVTAWFTREFGHLNSPGSKELYTFNRDFLFKVMGLASAQLAQHIKALGPNSHVDAACASTTQAILLARDWIRTGQAGRVLVVAADDVAGATLFPWIGSGFLAMGAATTEGNVTEAALPFDDRRHGLILGSAAVGLILEKEDVVRSRGMEPIATVECGVAANSAFHGTRLDVKHICSVMEKVVRKWEEQSGLSRNELAENVFFMSHETYSPKRGGSSAAEIAALRETFGDKARLIPIANTKGFTGHTMGVGIEDVVAMRCLQKGMLPPIANLRQPDPEFADMNLSKGGPCNANYVLRLAAGFGSQIVIALYRVRSRAENRVIDAVENKKWVSKIAGYANPVLFVEDRTLRVREQSTSEAAGAGKGGPDLVESARAEHVTVGPGSELGKEAVKEKIVSLLSAKTGYPPDMLDTSLDLEADLGIDTVKQAEFLSEVREAFGIPRIEGLKIADFPTIGHIIEFAVARAAQPDPSQTPLILREAPAKLETTSEEDIGEIQAKIVDLLSEKTGYPADMLDPDLDLEADLGIDTVKQAEFIAEIREMFGIPRIEGLKIADFPTLRHVASFVKENSQLGRPPDSAVDDEAQTEASRSQVEEIRLFETRLVDVPRLETITAPAADEVIIAGGSSSLVRELERALRGLGYANITKISEPVLEEEPANQQIGIVNLFPLSKNGLGLKTSFELFLACAKSLENGPAFFISVVSEDGAFGFESPGKQGHIAGAVAGATKSFAREYPDTLVRVLDRHPHLANKQLAETLARSLRESFPLETAIAKDGRLRAVRLVPIIEETKDPGIKPGDIVLVSGGARGITAECLIHLAGQAPVTMVLLGRTRLSENAETYADLTAEQWAQQKSAIIERFKERGTLPTPVLVEKELARLRAEGEVYRSIRNLRSRGADAVYRPVDISDSESVDRAIAHFAQTYGRVDLVIHAAGIEASRALKNKSPEQIESVVSVKIDGMRNLLESVKRHGLSPRRIVGFGSISGRFGNLAQIDYSAANDGLAHMLRLADREMDARVTMIDWAPWSEVGMAVRGSVQQTLKAVGIDFIAPQAGAQILASELGRSTGSCEVVAAGRLGPFEPDAFHVAGSVPDIKGAFAGQKGRIVSLLPGEYAKVAVYLDPSHPLLDHHRIGKAAVLPGVGGIDIMRAAAHLLNPETVGVKFTDVRFHSPLKIFRAEPFEAEVEVVRVPGGHHAFNCYHARISSRFVDDQGRRVGQSRLHHECRVVIGPDVADATAPFDHWDRSVWVSAGDLYSVFFHGPAFRFIDVVRFEDRGSGVAFRFQDTELRDLMFCDAVPAAIEAVFQAAAAWSVEKRGAMALPTGAKEIIVHRADRIPVAGRLSLVAEGTNEELGGRPVFAFDGVVTDQNGNAILTLKGVELTEFESSKELPGKVYEEIVAVAEIRKEIRDQSDVFLRRTLSQTEAQEYERLRVPKRAAEWLAGRVALKRAARRLMAESGNGEASPAENGLAVVPDEHGRPAIQVLDQRDMNAPDVSLSHSNGVAIASAALPDTFAGLGIDIEKVEERSEAWVQDYFTPREIAAARASSEPWRSLTAMWSLKEAAVKALGMGLRFDLKEIEVVRLHPQGQASLEFHDEAGKCLERTSAREVEARLENHNGLVIAYVLIRK